jgi:hypothetical protein
MSVSCVGAIAGSDAPAEVIPVMAIVIVEVPGGVTAACVTGALCAAAPPPPHPVTVQSATITRGTNTPPQSKRGCVPISRQRRKACAAIAHKITPAKKYKSTRRHCNRKTLSGAPLGASLSREAPEFPVVVTVIWTGTGVPLVTVVMPGTAQVAA